MNSFKLGIKSNYSLCCILTFYIRSLTLKLIEFILNRPIVHSSKPWKFNHVTCCYHKLLYLNRKPEYFKCKDCNWSQFNKQICNFCNKKGNIL